MLDNDHEKWGKEQSLTEISLDRYNFWHSASNDVNPSITFKMKKIHEVLSMEIVDRQNCCHEKFKSVEVRVGSTTSFDDAQSCGIQSYFREKIYRYDKMYFKLELDL